MASGGRSIGAGEFEQPAPSIEGSRTTPRLVDGVMVGQCNTCSIGRAASQIYSDERYVPIDEAMAVINEKCQATFNRLTKLFPDLMPYIEECPAGIWGAYAYRDLDA